MLVHARVLIGGPGNIDKMETQPYDLMAAVEFHIQQPEVVEPNLKSARVCRCKTMVLGEVGGGEERCEACVAAACLEQAHSEESAGLEPMQHGQVEEKQTPPVQEDCQVSPADQAMADATAEVSEVPEPCDGSMAQEEPQGEAQQADQVQESNNGKHEEPSAAASSGEGAGELHEGRGKEPDAAALSEPSPGSGAESKGATPVAEGGAQAEASSPNPAAEPSAPTRRKRRRLNRLAEPPLDEMDKQLEEEAKRAKDAAEADALAEDEKADVEMGPIDKNQKVNGYVLPPGWGAMPYITPQQQTCADGSAPKRRGRKPKVAVPAQEEPGSGKAPSKPLRKAKSRGLATLAKVAASRKGRGRSSKQREPSP